jgi:hypothetical protein
MFNLEASIIQWRRRMIDAGIKTPVPLDELEAHLREDVAELTRLGHSEAEAFAAAIEKMGAPNTVQSEFKKIDGAKSDFEWKVIEIVLGTFATLFPLWVYSEVLYFKTGVLGDLELSQQAMAATAAVAFGLFAWSGRWGYEFFPVIRDKRLRGIITTLCAAPVMLWWVIFMNFIVPHQDFTMEQFFVAFLWGFMTPAGLMLGAIWGIETAARQRPATP